jgi:hypothetical protein
VFLAALLSLFGLSVLDFLGLVVVSRVHWSDHGVTHALIGVLGVCPLTSGADEHEFVLKKRKQETNQVGKFRFFAA